MFDLVTSLSAPRRNSQLYCVLHILGHRFGQRRSNCLLLPQLDMMKINYTLSMPSHLKVPNERNGSFFEDQEDRNGTEWN